MPISLFVWMMDPHPIPPCWVNSWHGSFPQALVCVENKGSSPQALPLVSDFSCSGKHSHELPIRSVSGVAPHQRTSSSDATQSLLGELTKCCVSLFPFFVASCSHQKKPKGKNKTEVHPKAESRSLRHLFGGLMLNIFMLQYLDVNFYITFLVFYLGNLKTCNTLTFTVVWQHHVTQRWDSCITKQEKIK